MFKKRRSGEKSNCIYETYKNTVMPHGRHIYVKASDMAKATMCAYPQPDHALPYWKCVMRCCARYPSVNLPDQETDDKYTETFPSIHFLIYHLIASFSTHDMLPLTDKKIVASVNRILFQNSPKQYTLEKSWR